MFLSVIVPTRGRAQTLAETIESILRQSEAPEQILISAVEPSDVGADLPKDPRIKVLFGAPGVTRQRNRGIDALDANAQIVCMLDDDVELPDDYFVWVKRLLAARPDVAGFSGNILTVDDKTRAQAKEILRNWKGEDRFFEGRISLGCSMNLRRSVLDQVRFDERLALYGRLEDADFAARSLHLGKQGTYLACRVAHLMEQKARLPGMRYGFSQVMNPYYLWRKGSIPSLREVIKSHWFICFGSNTRGLFRPKGTIDYWGRLRGNLLAMGFILIGRIEPEYIEKL